MALLKRKTDEERQQAAVAAAEKQRQQAEFKRKVELEKAREAFYRTPAGQARVAFSRGDKIFQYSLNVMSQQAIVVPMVGANTAARTADPTVILNSVCHEGWDLVNGAFVFVEQGQESRDKFMVSGQNVAIRGMTVGYYLFRRCDENRVESPEPLEPGE